MGLPAQLPVTLLCLLAGTAHFIQGRRGDIILPEVIKTLNILTERKNTTEREAVCRAATALRQFYLHHKVSWCFKEHGELGDLRLLRGLDRNLCSMAKLSNCPGKEARQTTLEDFLDRLKTAMQEKYSKRQS
ncbi:interleukin-4 isoform 2 precursor [Oryctolagus cuniculus]|uniref:Interleukin-4 n=1 Tax=Oryctolagus cuniculus TaxID=9986 RepID=Q9MZR7_RABIT|nr:interleukin-4 isoform 2 precursor [Oryctolagus cuniculus]AAF86654.1 interleukin 4 variant IL-4delta2 [Oryctolagus cuniculus]